MPTDLLRYLSGPVPYSIWWAIIAALLIAVLCAWYASVFVWTLPPTTLGGIRGLAGLHRRLLARRFAKTVAAITGGYRSGAITPAQACADLNGTLRSFLHTATGQRAQYMHVEDFAHSSLAPAAPLIAELNEARFAQSAMVDVDRLGASVKELIRSWI